MTGRHDWTLQQDGAPSHIARNSIGWITLFGGLELCMSESATVGSLTPFISFAARDRAGVTRTATALHRSQHWIMETSFADAVCRGSEWRTHWTHVSLTFCTVKSFLEWCWNIFLSRAYSIRLTLQIISLDQMCWYTWRPLATYAFIKIKLASYDVMLLYVVYMYY